MDHTIRVAAPSPAKFTRRVRPGGIASIDQIQIHATRGPTTMERQVQATENWFARQPDQGGWGSSADFVVGPDEREGGRVVIVQFGNWERTFSSWSAGYGSNSVAEHGAAERAIAIEVAQPPRMQNGQYVGGDSDVPFTPETIDALAWLCRTLNDEIARLGGRPVPVVHVTSWDQLRSKPVPRGFIGHDELANGRKLGKTDPGRLFPWAQFLDLVQGSEALSPPLTTADVAQIWRAIAPGLPNTVRPGNVTITSLPRRGPRRRYELEV